MGATGLEIQRLMDRQLNRWWRRVGYWWIRVYTALAMVSILLTLLVWNVGPYLTNNWPGVVDHWLSTAVNDHGYLLIVAAWLGAVHELRREVNKTFLETAAPNLDPRTALPELFLAALRQGRWPVAAMVFVSALRVVGDIVELGSTGVLTGPEVWTDALAALVSVIQCIALMVVLIVVYLLAAQRRIVWVMLIAATLPAVYTAGLDGGLWQALGTEKLVDPPLFNYGGVVNVVFVAVLLGGLAWGRGFLGRALIWLYVIGQPLSLGFQAIWRGTRYESVHLEAWLLGLVQQATESLAATGGQYINDRVAHYVRIDQIDYPLIATDAVTAYLVLAVAALIWLAVIILVSYFIILRMIPGLTAPRAPGEGWGSPGYRRRWRDFALVCGGLVLVFWELVPCGHSIPMVGRMPDPGPPKERRELPQFHMYDTITDQRIAGLTIIDGLQAYFGEHGKYPPYLFGGGQKIHPNLGWWETGADRTRFRSDEKRHYSRRSTPKNFPSELSTLYWLHTREGVNNPDPLIAGGYLPIYPGGYYMEYSELGDLADLVLAQVTYGYCCLFSTPGDHAVLGGPGPLLYDAIHGPGGERTPEETEVVMQSMDPASYEATRHLALGGRRTWNFPLRFDSHFSLFPRGDEQRINSLYMGTHPVRDHLGMSYFGYQRGEYLQGSEREAWLWFYGPNEWASSREQDQAIDIEYPGEGGLKPGEVEYALFPRLTPLRGLDLLNARTGELKPDGIPDGICVLYKLRDGEIVDVVDAPDL